MEWENLQGVQQGEIVSVKGFLFQMSEGRWVLSTEPALKNCCIGSVEKQKSQIVLAGDFSHYPLASPLNVKGALHVDALGFYQLSNPQVIPKSSFPIWTAAVLLLCVCAFKLKRLLLP